MANRCQFENSNDIGVFSKLTNKYCLVASGGKITILIKYLNSGLQVVICNLKSLINLLASENFYSVFEAELAPHIDVIHTTIGGTRIIGRTTCGIFISLNIHKINI